MTLNQIFNFDAGSMPADHDHIIEEKIKENEKKEIAARIERFIPAEYQRMTFDNYICSTEKERKFKATMQKAAEAVIQGKFITICLLGTYGIGKTHLAIAAMRQVLSNKKLYEYKYEDSKGELHLDSERIFITANYALCDSIRERYEKAKDFKEDENQDDVIQAYSSKDLQIIDEIGRSDQPQREQNLIYKIMNQRDQREFSTILISNMNMTEFSRYVGAAVMDRLKNSAVFLDLNGLESHRGR